MAKLIRDQRLKVTSRQLSGAPGGDIYSREQEVRRTKGVFFGFPAAIGIQLVSWFLSLLLSFLLSSFSFSPAASSLSFHLGPFISVLAAISVTHLLPALSFPPLSRLALSLSFRTSGEEVLSGETRVY